MSEFFGIFFTTYGAVFIAEIVGDKLLYTTGVLATRYRSLSIIIGMAIAFCLKMGVAVAAGEFIARLPKPLLAAVTAASFLFVAITIWRKPDERPEKGKDKRVFSGALVAFATIFFSEWGDVGQLAAVGMASKTLGQLNAGQLVLSRSAVLMALWLGAVGAMVTKGILAASLGAGIRAWIADRVSPKMIRIVATIALLVLGTLAVLETLGILVD
jgi:putative Ca2+/H+ antiporter (TMEM165/GDT1 family)